MNPEHSARHRAALASLAPELRPLFQSCGTDEDGTRWVRLSDDRGRTRVYIDSAGDDVHGRGFAYLSGVLAGEVAWRLNLARQSGCPLVWPFLGREPSTSLPGGSTGGTS